MFKRDEAVFRKRSGMFVLVGERERERVVKYVRKED